MHLGGFIVKHDSKRVGCSRSVSFRGRTIDSLTREPTAKEKELMERCITDVKMQAGNRNNIVTQMSSTDKGTVFTAWEQLEVKAEVDPFMEGLAGFIMPN